MVALCARLTIILLNGVPNSSIVPLTWLIAGAVFAPDYELWDGHKERVDATLRFSMRKITISRWLETLFRRPVKERLKGFR
ncbi:MAG: hypothetical protein IE934_03825 [Sphingopyxis sp.]|nr:hypothetical protein [Sphingopyxis sp.]